MAQINNDFWIKETSQTFSDFFNNKNSGKGHWSVGIQNQQVTIKAKKTADVNLSLIFTQPNIQLVTSNNDINIYQFLIMTGIMLNETGGSFDLSTGEYGTCKYFFNSDSSIPKVSYNCSGPPPCSTLGNITAFDLFSNPMFLNVPARASMYKPQNPTDNAWKGNIYPNYEPVGIFKAGNSGKENYGPCGLIAECDFFKFRGRGPIQLTGRSNYKEFFKYIQTNKSAISSIAKPESMTIINNWSGSLDDIATKITNVEIDTLFNDNSIAILVFKTHSSNKYLLQMYNVSSSDNFIDLAYSYGKAIGGTAYATLFVNRLYEIIQNMPDWNSSQAT